MKNSAIRVRNLKKAYGDNQVLKGVNFNIERGSMLALLGPNGAGKTTTVRILSTLLPYDSGTVMIDGVDVGADPTAVRRLIGLTGQSASVDDQLTGRENLVMIGRLYRLTKSSAAARAQELLEEFDLVDAGDRPAKTYSGGMRRRLDLAVSLIAAPPIIFLDEPTTGLDPRSRLAMWGMIEKLKERGTTILLTTQYLDEADRLADKIIVIDGGKVIAEGTARQLKDRIGRDRLELTFATAAVLDAAAQKLARRSPDLNRPEKSLSLSITAPDADVRNALEDLASAKIKVVSIAIHKPTLDDVFMVLTGKQAAVTKQKGKA